MFEKLKKPYWMKIKNRSNKPHLHKSINKFSRKTKNVILFKIDLNAVLSNDR